MLTTLIPTRRRHRLAACGASGRSVSPRCCCSSACGRTGRPKSRALEARLSFERRSAARPPPRCTGNSGAHPCTPLVYAPLRGGFGVARAHRAPCPPRHPCKPRIRGLRRASPARTSRAGEVWCGCVLLICWSGRVPGWSLFPSARGPPVAPGPPGFSVGPRAARPRRWFPVLARPCAHYPRLSAGCAGCLALRHERLEALDGRHEVRARKLARKSRFMGSCVSVTPAAGGFVRACRAQQARFARDRSTVRGPATSCSFRG